MSFMNRKIVEKMDRTCPALERTVGPLPKHAEPWSLV